MQFHQTAEVRDTVRLSGPDRVATSIAIADDLWNGSEREFIVLALSETFPDALSGGSLAAALAAPLLLTPPDRLDDRVLEAMRRYSSDPSIILMGGTAALSLSMEQAIGDAGYRRPARVDGSNRYATAVKAANVSGRDQRIMIADGNTFEYALIAAAAAGQLGSIVLTAGGVLPEETRSFLDSHQDSPWIAVGEQAALAVPDAERIVGANAYETSALLAERVAPDYDVMAIASGENFPDGLAGAAHSGSRLIPLLLTRADAVPGVVVDFVAAKVRDRVYFYGGTAAISDRAMTQIGRMDTYFTCGFTLSCTMTLSRTATRAFCDEICDLEGQSVATIAAAAGAACLAAGGGLASLVCSGVAGAATSGYFTDLRQAAAQNACFQQRYFLLTGDPRAVVNPTTFSAGPDCDLASFNAAIGGTR